MVCSVQSQSVTFCLVVVVVSWSQRISQPWSAHRVWSDFDHRTFPLHLRFSAYVSCCSWGMCFHSLRVLKSLILILPPVNSKSLVYEKEMKLREIMKMMGLSMSTYVSWKLLFATPLTPLLRWMQWIVTYLFSFLLYFLAFLMLWAIAAACSFRYFMVNESGPLFCFFFLWGHLSTAWAILFSGKPPFFLYSLHILSFL